MKMKISIENYRFREALGDEMTIKVIADAGFDAMDFSYYWVKKAEDPLSCDYRDFAKRIRERLDAAGIVCNQAHAPFDFAFGESQDESSENYLRLTRSIESAAILGAEQIIVHRIGNPDKAVEWEYNLGFYRRLRKHAEKAGIRIAVENLFKWSPESGITGSYGKPEELCEVVEELGVDRFTCCVDLGHAAITGTAPEDFIAGMKDGMLGALHVQDNDLTSDGHLLPYMGRINWDAVMSALKAKNYDGDLTLEVFGWLGKLPASLMADAAVFAARTADQLRRL